MSQASQWTKVCEGASGSRQVRAKLRVPAGAPLQASGGERLAPSQVYFAGMTSPSAKAELERAKGWGSRQPCASVSLSFAGGGPEQTSPGERGTFCPGPRGGRCLPPDGAPGRHG